MDLNIWATRKCRYMRALKTVAAITVFYHIFFSTFFHEMATLPSWLFVCIISSFFSSGPFNHPQFVFFKWFAYGEQLELGVTVSWNIVIQF